MSFDGASREPSTEMVKPRVGSSESFDLEADELTQRGPMYDWDKAKSCGICCCNFVLQLVLCASLGSFLFGFNLSLLNTSISSINADLGWCGKQDPTLPADHCGPNDDKGCPGGPNHLDCSKGKWYTSFMQVAVFVGAAIGSMTGGRFVCYGRRLVFLVTMAIFTFGVVSSVVAGSFPALLWARLVVGYGVGVVSVVSPMYMAEVTPAHLRGAYGVFHQLFVTVGIFVAVLIGLPFTNPSEQDDAWVQPTFDKVWWRVMLGLGIVPVIVTLICFMWAFSFETPSYYVEQRRLKDAERILQRLYGKQEVREELSSIIEQVKIGERMKESGVTFASAFADADYRRVILFSAALSAFQQFGGINVFIASSNSLFEKAGMSGKMQTVLSTIMTFINVLMTFPCIYLIEKLGRKTLLMSTSCGQFISVLPAAICYWIDDDVDNPSKVTQILAIVGVFGFIITFAVGYGPTLWVYLFEVFPMEIRPLASAFATAWNWIAGIIMVFLGSQFNNRINYTLFAALQLVACLLIIFFMKETKGRELGDSPYIKRPKA